MSAGAVSQSSTRPAGRITGIRSWMAATVSLASVVRIVKVSTGGASGCALSCQLSQSPAKAKRGWSEAVTA